MTLAALPIATGQAEHLAARLPVSIEAHREDMQMLFTNTAIINAIAPEPLIVWAADGKTTEFALNRVRAEAPQVYGLCIITSDQHIATDVHEGPLSRDGNHRVYIFDNPPVKGALSLHIVYPLDMRPEDNTR